MLLPASTYAQQRDAMQALNAEMGIIYSGDSAGGCPGNPVWMRTLLSALVQWPSV